MRSTSRRRVWSARALAALLALGLGTGFFWVARPGAQPAPHPAAPSAVPVSAVRAKRQDVPLYMSGIGQVQAFNAVMVRARVDGTLMKVPVKEGQQVKVGDVIAVIDPRPYQAMLDQALAKKQQDEAQLANAKRDLARYQQLSQRNFASHQQVDQQEAQVAQLTAQIAGDAATIEAAQLNVSYAYITAPIPGRVGLLQIDPGNMIHASDASPIISIRQEQPIEVVFTLPESDLPTIMREMARRKLPVAAYSGENGSELGQGELLTPDNAIDPTTGTIKLKATFPNPDNLLWPGQYVQARLLVRTEHDVLTVPSGAVQNGPSGLYVYVVKPDSSVERQPIEAETRGDVAVIASGLAPGQLVVVSGQARLDTGTRVTIEGAPVPNRVATAASG
jgi:membrane fusion protein, multidrug efflux system